LVFDLNSNGIQMKLFKKENRKEKGEKTKKYRKRAEGSVSARARKTPKA
jgi:hypothetical protein